MTADRAARRRDVASCRSSSPVGDSSCERDSYVATRPSRSAYAAFRVRCSPGPIHGRTLSQLTAKSRDHAAGRLVNQSGRREIRVHPMLVSRGDFVSARRGRSSDVTTHGLRCTRPRFRSGRRLRRLLQRSPHRHRAAAAGRAPVGCRNLAGVRRSRRPRLFS